MVRLRLWVKVDRIIARQGFSLIATAMMILVLGLIGGAMIKMIELYTQKANITETQINVSEVSKAMRGYFSRHGRYPCPARLDVPIDSPEFGFEVGDDCTSAPLDGTFRSTGRDGEQVRTGAVPVRTLGLPDSAMFDAFDKRLIYAVTEVYAVQGSVVTEDQGAIRVEDLNGNTATEEPGSAIFLVMSHGPDINGAFSVEGALLQQCDTTKISGENCDFSANATFINSAQKSFNHGNLFASRLHFEAPRCIETSEARTQPCPEGFEGSYDQARVHSCDAGAIGAWEPSEPPEGACVPLPPEGCEDMTPQSCVGSVAPGTLCLDGTIYVGQSPADGKRMFTTCKDVGAYSWNFGAQSAIFTYNRAELFDPEYEDGLYSRPERPLPCTEDNCTDAYPGWPNDVKNGRFREDPNDDSFRFRMVKTCHELEGRPADWKIGYTYFEHPSFVGGCWERSPHDQYMIWNETRADNCDPWGGKSRPYGPRYSSTGCNDGEKNTAEIVKDDANYRERYIQPHPAALVCYCLGKPQTGVCAKDRYKYQKRLGVYSTIDIGGYSGHRRDFKPYDYHKKECRGLSAYEATMQCGPSHGYDDWYLPSFGEIKVMRNNLYAPYGYTYGYDPKYGKFTYKNKFNFVVLDSYWTSSEYDHASALTYLFRNEGDGAPYKSFYQKMVRCVRKED